MKNVKRIIALLVSAVMIVSIVLLGAYYFSKTYRFLEPPGITFI